MVNTRAIGNEKTVFLPRKSRLENKKMSKADNQPQSSPKSNNGEKRAKPVASPRKGGKMEQKLVDEVARNAIWREAIRKEEGRNRDAGLATFHFNPKTMHPLTEKPNAVTYRLRTSSSSSSSSSLFVDTPSASRHHEEWDQEMKATMRLLDRAPRSKYIDPITTAHEYGWHDPLMPTEVSQDHRFYEARKMCEITKYGDAYVTMKGKSPFASGH